MPNLDGLTNLLKTVKDALHTEVLPQQEPSYASFLTGDKGMSDENVALAMNLFYKACKGDEIKEVLIALINGAIKVFTITVLVNFLTSVVP